MRWRGQTVCILASGPSLTLVDAYHAHARARTIVINDTWRMVPDADVLYGADRHWWTNRAPSARAFTGERWTQDKGWSGKTPPDLRVVRSEAGDKLAPEGSDFVYTGSNSSFQALGLAVMWGASRVVFLGLDLKATDGKPNHWHPNYEDPVRNVRNVYPRFIKAFETVAPALAARGVDVVNCSRETALTCFPRATIQEALP